MRNFKRLAAAILTAALALTLITVPASAAPGSFIDVSDPAAAVNADILRLMGVVDGTGGNRFDPGGTLTRAQFCAMAIRFLQREEDVQRYATRTIFSDVKSSHWARGYVNMAASISFSGGDGENSSSVPLVSGVGDGRFLPDSDISLAEAVTILLRALGYTGKEAGSVWPQGYLDLAASIRLTDSLSAGAYDSITRAQAAQLFVNALKCKTGSGKLYYETIGAQVEKKTIILAVNVETDDGSSKGAIRTTSSRNSEAYLPAHGDGGVTALQGRRGDLVLDENEEIVAFIPDDSTALTITLNGNAQPAYVKGGSQQYTISSDATVFIGGGSEGKEYSSAYESLTSGTQITMYSEKGKIVAIYAASAATTVSTEAVVVQGNATAATFHSLTGGVTNFSIVKDRQPIQLYQIKPYDVVTYDQMTNTLVVSDLRMTAVYTDPTPNPKAPAKLRLVSGGGEIDVLQSAWDTIGDIKPGDNVTLLFTADGKVAGIVKPTAQTRSTAIGTVSGGNVTIFLPDGGTMELGRASNSSSVPEGQPVIVSAGRESFTVSRLPENRAPGDFDVAGLKLGSLTVSSGVRLFEQAEGGYMAAISRSDLAMESISTENIVSYHVNSANIVDYIILNDVTGSAYIYGMMVGGYESTSTQVEVTDKDGKPVLDEDGNSVYETQTKEWYTWRLRSRDRDIDFTRATTYKGASGDMVGVVLGRPVSGEGDAYTLKSVTKLTEIKNVKRGDFFDSQGDPYVSVNGKTYRISGDVECYYNRSGNKAAKENWLAGGAAGLASLKTYSDSFTIYIDPIGQQVRIVAAN